MISNRAFEETREIYFPLNFTVVAVIATASDEQLVHMVMEDAVNGSINYCKRSRVMKNTSVACDITVGDNKVTYGATLYTEESIRINTIVLRDINGAFIEIYASHAANEIILQYATPESSARYEKLCDSYIPDATTEVRVKDVDYISDIVEVVTTFEVDGMCYEAADKTFEMDHKKCLRVNTSPSFKATYTINTNNLLNIEIEHKVDVKIISITALARTDSDTSFVVHTFYDVEAN